MQLVAYPQPLAQTGDTPRVILFQRNWLRTAHCVRAELAMEGQTPWIVVSVGWYDRLVPSPNAPILLSLAKAEIAHIIKLLVGEARTTHRSLVMARQVREAQHTGRIRFSPG